MLKTEVVCKDKILSLHKFLVTPCIKYKRTWHTWYLCIFCKRVVLLQIFKYPFNQNEKLMNVFRLKHVNIHTK